MKKSLALILLCIVVSAVSVFATNTNVSVSVNMPESIECGTEFVVDITVFKGEIGGFAKIQQMIPIGFKAVQIESKGATFSFKDQKVKFLWMSLPADDEFVVSYKIIVDNDIVGDFSLGGTFSYIENSQTLRAQLEKKNIKVTCGDMVASNNQPDTKTSSDEIDYSLAEKAAAEAEAAEKKAQEDKAAQERAEAAEKAKLAKEAAEKAAAEEAEATTKVAEEKKSEEQKIAEEKLAAEKKATEEQRATEAKAELEKKNEEAASTKAAEEKKAEEQRVAAAKAVAEKKAEEKRTATARVEAAKKAAEEKAAREVAAKKAAEEKEASAPKSVDGLVFRIQVASTSEKKTQSFIQNRYSISDKVSIIEQGGAYKYVVGSFSSYDEAKRFSEKIKSNVSGAFVVAYNNGKKISLKEAVNMIK